eukprot:TRINITY_DN8832_c0_g1_i1.p1 TRINITY_DN8832_c0_g1~~TRINITY_DN8832_c0_g1_i1.p1  ORF type:complete len:484 (-),score=45.26 TRINITY_DN8832_c0_g1_i1:295-1746(-)
MPLFINLVARSSAAATSVCSCIIRWHVLTDVRSVDRWLKRQVFSSIVGFMIVCASGLHASLFICLVATVGSSYSLTFRVLLDDAKNGQRAMILHVVFGCIGFAFQDAILLHSEIFGLGFANHWIVNPFGAKIEYVQSMISIFAICIPLNFVFHSFCARRRIEPASSGAGVLPPLDMVVPQSVTYPNPDIEIGTSEPPSRLIGRQPEDAAEPSVLEVTSAPIGGDNEKNYHSENTSTFDVTYVSENGSESFVSAAPGELVMVGVSTLAGVLVFQQHLLRERTLQDLKHMIEQTSFWPEDLHCCHMELMLNDQSLSLLNSATLSDLDLVSKANFTVIVKPVVCITCSLSGFGLTSSGEGMSVLTSSEDPGTFVVTKNSDGMSVRISTPCGRLLVQDRLGRVRFLPAMDQKRLQGAIEHHRLELGVDWRLEGHLRADSFEHRIRNVRYGTLLLEKRMTRLPGPPYEHDVRSDAGANVSEAARWIFM